jgi:hypothetical protein
MRDAVMKDKKYTLEISGDVYRGTAVKIVKAMQTSAFFDRDKLINAYLDKFPAQIKRLAGVDVTVTGTTDAEYAENLMREPPRAGLATEAT